MNIVGRIAAILVLLISLGIIVLSLIGRLPGDKVWVGVAYFVLGLVLMAIDIVYRRKRKNKNQ